MQCETTTVCLALQLQCVTTRLVVDYCMFSFTNQGDCDTDINTTDGLAEKPQALPASSNAVPPFQTLDDPEWAAVTLTSHLERLQEASNNVDIENLSDFMTDLQLVHNTETCSSYVLSGSMCQCKFAM